MIRSSHIPEERCESAIRREDNIGGSVIVDVAVSGASGHARRVQTLSHLCSYVVETSAREVVKEMRRLSIVHTSLNAFDIWIEVPVGNKNVRPAIQIIVEEKAAKAQRQQARPTDLRLRCHIDKE